LSLAQNFQLNQKQVQKLALSQDMQQSILMLQLDVIDLTNYLKNASLENPLIEVKPHLERDVAAAALSGYPIADTHQSLFDYLLEQVHLAYRKTPLRDLLVYLIKQLDPSGYLLVDDATIMAELKISKTMLLDAKTLLQQLDPPGIGASNLQECLILQAEYDTNPVPAGVLPILQEHFDTLVAQNWAQLKSELDLTEPDLQACLDYIHTLYPYPGQLMDQQTPTQYILPELKVTQDQGKLRLAFFHRNQPEIIFEAESYDHLRQSTDAEVQQYVQDKYRQYQALTYNLQRRRETLLLIGKQIMTQQYDFLSQKSTTLAPLLLRDIAQTLQISESTVSRTINSKYMVTDFGTFPLKAFFSRRSQSTDGDNAVSVDQLLAQIKALVAKEDKAHPLSDDTLAQQLSDQGFDIARRTVAKYRKQLEIPASSKRRVSK
jgi:RNA polymerase sigma-54 factor